MYAGKGLNALNKEGQAENKTHPRLFCERAKCAAGSQCADIFFDVLVPAVPHASRAATR